MTTDTANVLDREGWRDGLEAGVRRRIRGFIEELLEEELTAALGRARYGRARERERLPLAAGRDRRPANWMRGRWCRWWAIAMAIAIAKLWARSADDGGGSPRTD